MSFDLLTSGRTIKIASNAKYSLIAINIVINNGWQMFCSFHPATYFIPLSTSKPNFLPLSTSKPTMLFGCFLCLLSWHLVHCIMPPRTLDDTRSESRINNAPSPITKLPETLRPIQYLITIRPYFTASNTVIPSSKLNTVDTTSLVLVECVAETSEIVVNSHALTVLSVAVTDADGNEMVTLGSKPDPVKSQLVITLQTPIRVGKRFTVKFLTSAPIHKAESPNGLYVSTYQANGTEKYMLVSHFETSLTPGEGFFRSLTPSFDEPAFKASFQFTYIYPAEYTALNNMPELLTTSIENGWKKTLFQSSPKMSSYLNAIIIGDLAYKETVNNAGTRVRIYGWTGTEHLYDDALYAASESANFFGHYYAYPYPLHHMPKMDIVGVAHFGPGAMENYGLLIHRFSALFNNPRLSSQSDKYNVMDTLLHEVAHQWFGDLVTTGWWSNIFLNEGFASFNEKPAGIAIYPQDAHLWMSRYGESATQEGLVDDDRLNQPVISDHPPQFTGLTYNKASALYRMVKMILGEDVFRRALQLYLKQFAFANVLHNDLWAKFDAAAVAFDITGSPVATKPLNVTRLMNPYVLQAKYPIVDVMWQPDGSFLLSQRPSANVSTLPPSLFEYQWTVPVWYLSAVDTTPKLQYMEPNSQLSVASVQWLLVNPQSRSYLRTHYDDHSWALLLAALRKQPWQNIDVMSLSGLFDDSAHFVNETGQMERQLNLCRLLRGRTDYLAWNTATTRLLNQLYFRFRTNLYFPVYQRFTKDIYGASYCDIGFNATVNTERLIAQEIITEGACRTAVLDCNVKAYELFRDMLDDCSNNTGGGSSQCSRLTPDFRQTAYCYGAAQASNEEYTQLLALFQHELRQFTAGDVGVIVELQKLRRAVACAGHDTSAQRLITLTRMVAETEATVLLAHLALNPLASDGLFSDLQNNSELVFAQSLKYRQSYFAAMVKMAYLNSQIEKLSQWADRAPNEENRKLIEEAAKQIVTNQQWHRTIGRVVVEWIYNNYAQTTEDAELLKRYLAI